MRSRKAFGDAKVISVKRYPSRGYEVKIILLDPETGGAPRRGHSSMKMRVAFSLKDGCFIGLPREAFHLWKNFGICPERNKRHHRTCSIGKGRDGKWYGWSHRAIRSFKSHKAAGRFAESVS